MDRVPKAAVFTHIKINRTTKRCSEISSSEVSRLGPFAQFLQRD